MGARNLFRKITFYISAPRCLCCGVGLSIEDLALCERCLRELYDFGERECAICKKPLYECSCVPKHLSSHFIKRLSKSFRYLGIREEYPLPSLIYSLKNKGRIDAVELAARLMEKSIRKVHERPEEFIFTFVPRRRATLFKVGHDHAALLSKRLSEIFGGTYMPTLKSRSKREQKTLSNEERMKNVVLSPIKDIDLTGKRILIVDDVVTTGASMGTAAAVIRSLGAKEIFGAVLAVAYKDTE